MEDVRKQSRSLSEQPRVGATDFSNTARNRQHFREIAMFRLVGLNIYAPTHIKSQSSSTNHDAINMWRYNRGIYV